MSILTTPTQSSCLQINDYICIKNRPCQIIDKSISKTGKHGGCKLHLIAVDIFNNQRHEHLVMSTKNIDVPYISKTDYQLVSIDDNIVSYFDKDGKILNDLFLPNITDSDVKLSNELKNKYENDEEIFITVVSAMNISEIKGYKTKK